MSIYHVPDPDDEIQCPYDDTHMIRAKRMPYHLIKCRKNHLHLDFVTCPFNAQHEMPRPELRYHMANCPDKALLYRPIVHQQSKKDENTLKGYTGVPKYESDWDSHESGENWDDEVPHTGAIMFYGKKKDLKRKQGLVNGSMSSEPQLRLPRETPQVLKAAMSEKEALPPKQGSSANKQQPSSVFAYSAMKTMPGIGRGRAVAKQPAAAPAPPGGAQANQEANGKTVGRGQPRIAANIFPSHPATQASRHVGPETLTDSLAALSRGRGMAMKLKTPTVGGAASAFTGSSAAQAPVMNGMGSGSSSASGSPAPLHRDPEEARKRELRKLNKKLREMEALEEKQRMGVQLNQEELDKLARKDEVLLELSSFSM